MIANKNKKLNRKRKITFSKKRVAAIITPTFLVSTLIFTNITVSIKTYQLINSNKEIESLSGQFKDLNEEKEGLISPAIIRERAINDLGMVDIEKVEDLILIKP